MKTYNIILGAAIVFFIVTFLQCKKVTEISELVKNTDKIQVVVFHDSGDDTFVDITDKKTIRKFEDYISDEDTPVYNCGFNGKIVFYMNTDVASGEKNAIIMQYSTADACAHIEYPYAGSLETKKISPSGLDYLRSLQ